MKARYKLTAKAWRATPEGKAMVAAQNRRKAHDGNRAEHYRAKSKRRRARLAGVQTSLTAAEWRGILDDHLHRCAYCGTDGVLEQDHVIPVSKGGPHTAENVVPACPPCNNSKSNHDMEPWLLSQ